MKVNIQRLMKNLSMTGKIGINSNGGITRSCFSKEYFEALNVLEELFIKSGLKVSKDKVGNMIGYRDGKNPNAKSIMIGSHLDTVINGRLYDGNLGVVSSLEIVNMLNDLNIVTEHPIEVVAFNAEEGSELGVTFGSRVMIGRQNLEIENIEEKLNTYNLKISDLVESKKDMSKVGAFVELHIEQGGYLINNGYDIGVVNGIVGIKRYRIEIVGESNHGGTTPMFFRKDPVIIVGKFIEKINQLSREKYSHPFVSTIGNIKVEPGMYNVIPEKVILFLECRDIEEKNLVSFIEDIKEYAKIFGKEYTINFKEDFIEQPKMLSSIIMDEVKKSVDELGYKNIIMSSGAGHDSQEIIYKVPTGMIFIPSVGGISHSPKEYSTEEQIEKGVEVLFKTVIGLDKNQSI